MCKNIGIALFILHVFFSTRSHQNLIWVTEVKYLNHTVEEVIPSLRVPIFAMQPLQTTHTFREYRAIQSHRLTSPR